jgi:hypothetical protein
VIVYGEKPQACTDRRLSSGLCYGDGGNDNLTLSTDVVASPTAVVATTTLVRLWVLAFGFIMVKREMIHSLATMNKRIWPVAVGLTPLYAIRRERISLSIIDQSKTAM